jgi:aminocarboxymuconate-semialdehyde decarboxylase
LQLIVKNQTSKQIIMGLDDPYPLGEMESESQSSYPGKILDLAQDEKILTSEECDAIWDDNVLQWLFGDDKKKKQDLINKIIS